MNLTEEEAKTKWCPFARAAAIAGENSPYQSANRVVFHFSQDETRARQDDTNPPSCRCVASDCMAWRWRSLNPDTIKPEHRRGCCGLAGEAR